MSIRDEQGKFKKIRLFEGKTQKERRIQLNQPNQCALVELRQLFDR